MNKTKVIVLGMASLTFIAATTFANPTEPKTNVDGSVTGIETIDDNAMGFESKGDDKDYLLKENSGSSSTGQPVVNGQFVTAERERPTTADYYSDDKVILRWILDGGVHNKRKDLLASLGWSLDYGVKPDSLSTQRLSLIATAYSLLDSSYSPDNNPKVGFNEYGFIKHTVKKGMGVEIEAGLLGSPDQITVVKYSGITAGDIYYNKDIEELGIYLGKDSKGNSQVITCSEGTGKVSIETYPKVDTYYRVIVDSTY